MNIRTLIVSVLVILSVASCVKESEYSEKVFVEISVPKLTTKSIEGTSEENAVNDLQVFIFDQGGFLEAYGHAGGSSLSLTCVPGVKEVVALVNERQLTDITTIAELKENSSYLSDNSHGSFVMEGKDNVNLTSSSSLTIPVRREAARISVEKIDVDFELEQHDKLTFQITSIFLMNVAGDRKYLDPGSPTIWYNETSRQTGTPDITSVELSDAYASKGSPYSIVHNLYCYPNPLVSDGSEEVKHTKLVVEAELGGTRYYYPLELNELKSNTSYAVKLQITRLGVSRPDQVIDSQTASFSLYVSPWNIGASYDEII